MYGTRTGAAHAAEVALLLGSELGEELGGFLLEVRLAALAAELHLLPLVNEHDGVAHRAQLFARDDANVEGVRLGGGIDGRRGIRRRTRVLAAGEHDEGGRNESEIQDGLHGEEAGGEGTGD